jgi:hypothetical protein
MRAYKFLSSDGRGLFSRFAWPLPNGEPAAWVESEVEPCRAGIHACRKHDLPYWIAPALYEIELEGLIEEHAIKVVAARGRLIRRIGEWDASIRDAYGEMCFSRAHELVAASEGRLDDWAPTSEIALRESARLGFISATIAERLGGVDAHLEERRRQSDWLVENLPLD